MLNAAPTPIQIKAIFKEPFAPSRAKLWRTTEMRLSELTGHIPVYSDKNLKNEPMDPYLRFRFESRNQDYEEVRVLLDLLGAEYFAESAEHAELLGIRETFFESLGVLSLSKRNKLYLEVKYLLTVLTGQIPTCADKKLYGEKTSPYLCFRFEDKAKDYEETRANLKFFGIEYFDELGEKGALLGVPETAFRGVDNLFSTLPPQEVVQGLILPIDNYTSRERIAIFNLLFSQQRNTEFDNRNTRDYDLCKLMLWMVRLATVNLQSIIYLAEEGIQISYKALSIEAKTECNEDASQSRSATYVPAFAAVKNENLEVPIKADSAPAVVTPPLQSTMQP